ncbi:decarboxylating 6-phosphogluconate dehydrogenase [Corallococcus sp. H22C18031201]|uniref:phosphogluconate dehydrogenase (NAD(+)-dependent, decarboxylating) n=1 Tax=Citreicoccus inhibens TaxID=2849499 RepID=UPI000E714B92|nr:decarboxylating 6-phosphogluconate dehydrogenase [Citreicoccus inhibens]MBU8894953.1 decarboxylating 6-phosphogluconate dehydrogenase [Citreicoccus inhibens]RJS27114.1 decarboxylating 6-phosphogluconate dehydrogenase [Corallococcus sp. H22C18031201]
MDVGMVGLGRMGANMALRLLQAGHRCVVTDIRPAAVDALRQEGATGADSIEALVRQLAPPRAVWLMLPAGLVDLTLQALIPLLEPGDTVIDGGNSYYLDDLRRAAELRERHLHAVDVGVSGGVWGRQRGYCLMVGGEADVVTRLAPLFASLAPGVASAERLSGDASPPLPAEEGWLHCGPHGAGHFVKMVHNGIEYGLMAAYAEGFNILHKANAGKHPRPVDAETAPLRHPEHYLYDFDLGAIAEVWRRGSVISSWLLDLSARALRLDPTLQNFSGRVADSGEGRWTLEAADHEGVPVPVLAAALFARFSAQGASTFANQLLSAMRFQFGGHLERPTPGA